MTRCTIKDIALRCGVSTAVVSSVLSGNTSKISCSSAKKSLIRQTAADLNYQPNALARSIKTREIPIIGVFFHRSEETPYSFRRYTAQMLSDLTVELNSRNLEVLFAPYDTEEKQLIHMKQLLGQSLIGGIVTNILPNSHRTVCRYLANTPCPYMILGLPEETNVYSVCSGMKLLEEKALELSSARGCAECFMVTADPDKMEFRAMPFQGYYLREPILQWEEIREKADRSFFVVMGEYFLRLLEERGIRLKNFAVVEDEEHLFRTGHDAFCVSRESTGSVLYAASALDAWMRKKQPPKEIRKIFDGSAGMIRFIPSGVVRKNLKKEVISKRSGGRI